MGARRIRMHVSRQLTSASHLRHRHRLFVFVRFRMSVLHLHHIRIVLHRRYASKLYWLQGESDKACDYSALLCRHLLSVLYWTRKPKIPLLPQLTY